MMPALTIGLRQLGGKPLVTLSKSGEISATRLLIGRNRAEAMRLVPLIFNLCPAAQSTAAAIAMGRTPEADASLRIAVETLREHALVMVREWPAALGRQSEIEMLGGLTVASLPGRLDSLERVLFGGSADFVLRDFEAWLSQSGASVASDLATVAGWPKAPGQIACADPTFVGRVLFQPALKRIVEAEGITLFARMAARTIEAASLIVEIRSGNIAARYGAIRDGEGWVEAARGRLTHSVRLRNGLIESYCITTPTDGMTGDGTFLEALLRSASEAPAAIRRQQIAIAMTCADPCMPVVWDEEAMHDA